MPGSGAGGNCLLLSPIAEYDFSAFGSVEEQIVTLSPQLNVLNLCSACAGTSSWNDQV